MKKSNSRMEVSEITLKKQTKPNYKFTAKQIPNLSRSINVDRLMMQPVHKPNRTKFDRTNSECIVDIENNPQTM